MLGKIFRFSSVQSRCSKVALVSFLLRQALINSPRAVFLAAGFKTTSLLILPCEHHLHLLIFHHNLAEVLDSAWFTMFKSLKSKYSQSHTTPVAASTEGSSSSTQEHEIGIVTAKKVSDPHVKIPEEAIEQAVHGDGPNEEAQHGVTQAEAITLTWTKTSLGCAYIL